MSVSVTFAAPGADAAASVEVSEGVFGSAFNEALVHQAVVAYLAGARQGSKAQKSRADARGGGRKPWRQKRTGRARAGSIRSPLWRGGGRTFAARPRDHSVKLNRKMYRGAMRCILAELVRQNRLQAIPPAALSLAAPKTKLLDEKLRALASTPGAKLLLVAAEVPRNLYLAARNLRGVDVCDVEALDPVALVSHDTVLIEVDALRRIEENLQRDAKPVQEDAANAAESDCSEESGDDEAPEDAPEGAPETDAQAPSTEASAPVEEAAPETPAEESTSDASAEEPAPDGPPAEEAAQ